MNKKEIEILLVEDNEDDAIMTLRALQKHNLTNKVYHVIDGEAALDFFFKEKKKSVMPRVVFLDLKLPKVDGLEVLKELRQNEMTRTIPVVILTSSKEDRDVDTAYKLGANSYIVKPVDFEKFINSVAELGLYWVILNEPPK